MKINLLILVLILTVIQPVVAKSGYPIPYFLSLEEYTYHRRFTPSHVSSGGDSAMIDDNYDVDAHDKISKLEYPTAFHNVGYADSLVAGASRWKDIDSSKYYGMLKLKKIKKQREILESSPFVNNKSTVSRKKRDVEYYTSFSDLVLYKDPDLKREADLVVNEDGVFYKKKQVCLNEVNDQRVWHKDRTSSLGRGSYEVLLNDKNLYVTTSGIVSVNPNMGDQIYCKYKNIKAQIDNSRTCVYAFSDFLTKNHYHIESLPENKERKAVVYPRYCERFPAHLVAFSNSGNYAGHIAMNFCLRRSSGYVNSIYKNALKKGLKFDDVKLDMSIYPCVYKTNYRNLIEMEAIDLDKNIGIIKYQGESFYLSLDVFEKRTLGEYLFKNFHHKFPEELISYYPKKEQREKRAFIAMPKNHSVPFDTMLKYYDAYSDLKTINTRIEALRHLEQCLAKDYVHCKEIWEQNDWNRRLKWISERLLKGKISADKIREGAVVELRKQLKKNTFVVQSVSSGIIFSKYPYTVDVAGKKFPFELQLYRTTNSRDISSGYSSNPYDTRNKWRWVADLSMPLPPQHTEE